MEELKRIVEALLFASPDPLSAARIRTIVPGLEHQHVVETIDELRKEYADDSRAFQIVEIGGGYQLTSKPDYSLWVGKLFEARAKQRLSKAALETLAVVAYKQPVLRSTIESIRGVNVDGVLRTLMERDLVRIVGRGEGPGRPLLFGTTRDFLMRFGLSRLSDLPKVEEIDDLVGEKKAEGEPLEETEMEMTADSDAPPEGETEPLTEASEEETVDLDTDPSGEAGVEMTSHVEIESADAGEAEPVTQAAAESTPEPESEMISDDHADHDKT
jgi:segregation and condensation protein B